MAGRKPEYDVFVSKEREGDKPFYTRVGGAWNVAKDGISIELQALPVEGRLVLFPRRDDEGS
jgi:hypothetical protein